MRQITTTPVKKRWSPFSFDFLFSRMIPTSEFPSLSCPFSRISSFTSVSKSVAFLTTSAGIVNCNLTNTLLTFVDSIIKVLRRRADNEDDRAKDYINKFRSKAPWSRTLTLQVYMMLYNLGSTTVVLF